MQVQILEESWSYGNDQAVVEKLMADIGTFLDQAGLYLSAMKVDTNTIYDDYEDYIIEHIREIECIEVVAHTVKEMTNEVLLSTEQYLERAIPHMQQLAREFYQGPESDSWDNMSQMAEGIQWIHQMVHSVVQAGTDSNVMDTSPFKEIINQLDGAITGLSEGVEVKDTVAIADALTYELLPAINELYELIKNTIDDKVVRPHVS
jgi:hypothetical protein